MGPTCRPTMVTGWSLGLLSSFESYCLVESLFLAFPPQLVGFGVQAECKLCRVSYASLEPFCVLCGFPTSPVPLPGCLQAPAVPSVGAVDVLSAPAGVTGDGEGAGASDVDMGEGEESEGEE